MSPHYNAGSGGSARKPHHPGTGSRKKKVKERPPSGRVTAASEDPQNEIVQTQELRGPSIRLSQKVLDIFAAAFPDLLDSSASDSASKLTSTLQLVKQHLYKRDFSAAFGSEEFLAAYAIRWSASRALAYLTLFDEVFDYIDDDKTTNSNDEGDGSSNKIHVAAIGGGAGAELLGLASVQYLRTVTNVLNDSTASVDSRPLLRLSLTSLDRAAWISIHNCLYQAITTPPTLSQYASAAARAANHALAEHLEASCLQLDALSSDQATKNHLEKIIRKSSLITLMFTLNELYSENLSGAQRLLAEVTAWTSTQPGTLLLIVDSPGSYSEVGIGPQSKKYPMRWLLDLALLGPPDKKDEDSAPWEKLINEESRWFRLPTDGHLSYPIDLENMRYQMHLYRRR